LKLHKKTALRDSVQHGFMLGYRRTKP